MLLYTGVCSWRFRHSTGMWREAGEPHSLCPKPGVVVVVASLSLIPSSAKLLTLLYLRFSRIAGLRRWQM